MASGMITTPAPTGYLDPQTGQWVSGLVASDPFTPTPDSAAERFSPYKPVANTAPSAPAPVSGLDLAFTNTIQPLPVSAPAPTEVTSQEWGTMVNNDAGIADTAANNGAVTADAGATSLASMQAIKSTMDNMSSFSEQGTGPGAKVGGGLGAGAGAVIGGVIGTGIAPGVGTAIGAALGSAAGGALGLGVGSLLDFIATADSSARGEIEARQRAAKLAQFENMAKSQQATAYTQLQRDNQITDKALAAKRMRDALAIYMARKTAKLIRQGLVAPVAPGAPVTQYNTSTYRSGLTGGIK